MDNSVPNQTNDDQNANLVPVQQQQQQPTAQTVGSVAKEHGPVGVSEFIKPSGPEIAPVIPPEVAEHGVEAVTTPERPQLTEHHKTIGMEHAKESVPAPIQPASTSHIQLPMTEEEALQTIKTTGVNDSKHWLAILIEKVYKKLQKLAN